MRTISRFKDNTSQEVYATVARTDLPLSPTLSVYYDFNLGSGLYVTLGGSHELKMSEKVSMEVGGLIGFNSRQYIDKTGFSDIDLYVKVPLAVGKLTLTPSLNVMIPLAGRGQRGHGNLVRLLRGAVSQEPSGPGGGMMGAICRISAPGGC